MDYITDSEAAVLSTARRVLEDLMERASEQHTYQAGIIKYSAEVAEQSIFECLNVIAAHGKCPVADKWLFETKHAVAQ